MKPQLYMRATPKAVQLDMIGDVGDGELSIPAVKAAIDAAKARSNKLVVVINSAGGNAWAGDGIYTALRGCGMHVTTRCEGYALSAASLILMAGDVRQAAKNSVIMIHDPHGATIGTAEDHQKSIDAMNAIADRYAGIYADRTGMTQEKCRELMKAETWFSADEALQAGFVTEVIQENHMAASFDLTDYHYKRIAACAQQRHGMSASKRWALAKDEAKAAVSEFDQRRNPAALVRWIDNAHPGLRMEFIEETNAKVNASR